MEVSGRTLNLFLLGCVFVFVGTEVLLSPFYPQFFEKVFGINDPDFTGLYILACRLTVVLFTPVWGYFSKVYRSSALLAFGQCGAGLSCFLMASSDSIESFVAASVLLLIFKSSYFLLYTIMIEKNLNSTGLVAARYHTVIQAAIVTATFLSGWVIKLEHPLVIFWSIGAMECVLGLFTYSLFNKRTTLHIKDSQDNKRMSGYVLPQIMKIGLAILTLHLAINMIRPFFTLYTERVYETDTFTSSILYMIPSLMMIIALPVVKKCSSINGLYGYILASLMVMIGIFCQGMRVDLTGLILFRCLFGLGAAWCLTKLDVVIFHNSNNAHTDYSKLSAVQNAGLLLAPITASTIVNQSTIASVFFWASLLIGIHIAAFVWVTNTQKDNTKEIQLYKEEKHVIYK